MDPSDSTKLDGVVTESHDFIVEVPELDGVNIAPGHTVTIHVSAARARGASS